MNPKQRQPRADELYDSLRELSEYLDFLQGTPNADDHTYRLMLDTQNEMKEIVDELQELLADV